MVQTCRQCNQAFEITESDLAFYEKVSPVFGGKKELIPPPTRCPDCRQQRRLAFNNELRLYNRKCDLTGEDIVSIHRPGKTFPVYSQKVWREKADALRYGSEVDLSRPIFEQIRKLTETVPYPDLHRNYLFDENSDYTNYSGSNKNCYLIAHADENRDCYYSYGIKQSTNCVDCYNVFTCELCFECVDCQKCYNLKFSQNCVTCSDSAFLKDCIGCANCFGCKGLVRKQYCVFNEQKTKEEYEAFMAKIDLRKKSHVDAARVKFADFETKVPSKNLRILQCENSVGDFLTNCKNVFSSYNVADMEDGRYCYQIYNGSKDCMDMYQFGLNAELVYEGSIVGYNSRGIAFGHQCNEQDLNLVYCINSYQSKNCFACVGLHKNEYCILNRQYSKEEYVRLVPKIIERMRQTGEWGEFFDPQLSAFGYNETTAMDYFPLTKEEALAQGFKWSDFAAPKPQVAKIVKASQLPDSLERVPDEILDWAIECEISGRPFRVIKQELKFLRERGLPLPRRHFDIRNADRAGLRNPRKLLERNCANCSKAMKTTYPENAKEKVFCEECYRKEVF